MNVTGSEDAHLTQRAVGNAEKLIFVNYNLVLLGRGDDNVSGNYIRNVEGGVKILVDIFTRRLVEYKLLRYTKSSIERHYIELAKQYYWSRNYRASLENMVKLRNCPKMYLGAVNILIRIVVRVGLKKIRRY